ncbi:MAG: eukaryotic-like serine/threonine-protein kinase [Acidobacteriota bacterium]|jgi:tetratricopeptide (TPR) repeat protein/tRNA A-37 threonylcarbamoyl transferase component Bud32|nr:eukaryotic-like serine/threonine-protein kinase [Acidobacteriota bacterium]
MSQPSSAATSSFTVVCPGCGQRLRFSIGAETPPRVRIRCSDCNHQFGVKRPGAEQGDVTVAGATPPTLVGTPISSAPTLPTAPRPSGEPAFAPGERIAERYRVVRFLARGGMGEVYEVEDQELRERVALKTVRGDVSRDNLAIERFRREIQLARKVTHPNVCRIFDVAFHGGVIFLTMELLEGETLAQRLRRAGPMSTEEALPVARQIAEALHAAHQVGIVHRDLKPGNVVLSEARGTPRAVVTDFGLARLESGEDAMTLTAHAGVVGTPAYLAPEQVEGKEITGAVDIYALGIVLYEMLTGTVPFVGDTALSVAVRRLQERPASPRVHVPGLDARWEAAILRCLERDPAARFHSAPEAVQSLTEPFAPKIEEEKPAPAPAPAPVAAKKNKLQTILLAALLLLAAGIGTVRYLGWRAEQEQTPEQRLARLTEGITARRSVAVLGFQNLSRTPGTEWLSTGIAEMLASELGAGGGLRIVPGENVARAKVELGLSDANSLAADTLSRVRTILGSDAVVLGSFAILESPAGRKIRLDVRLQDTLAGETTSVAETGPEAELFDLVAKAGRRLREEMGAGPIGDQSVKVQVARASSTDAARLYSEGINRLRLFEPAAARELLERAVAVDPRNALAHSGLASALTAIGYDRRAREEAKAAFDLSANLPPEDRLIIEGRYRETTQDWRQAVQIYWDLWSMFPDDLDHGLRLAAAQTAAGQVEEALATTDALRTLPPPSSEDPRIDLAEAMAAGARADFQRQHSASARAAEKASGQRASLMVAQARLMECRALRNLGQAKPALAFCAEGQRLYAAKGDRAGMAEALTHAANVRFDQGELAEASRLYQEALDTYRAIGNRGAEAGALNNIAVVLRSQGDLDRASQLYEEVLAISREIGSRAGEAYALNNLAGVLLRRGRLDEAGRLFEQALAIRREQGDKSGEAYALDNLGVALRRKGDLAGARHRHDLALRLRKETGQRIGEVSSLNNLGTLFLDQGDLAAARKSFETSLAACRETGSQSSMAYALFGLGEVLAREGKLPEARKSHEEALALREKLGEKGTAAESRLALAILALEQGDRKKAVELAGQAAAELERQGATDGQALALAVAGQGREALALLEGSQDLRARLAVQVRTAVSPKALEEVLDQATRAGFTEIRLEAGLALARTDRSRRSALEQEAKAKGYTWIARKAAS